MFAMTLTKMAALFTRKSNFSHFISHNVADVKKSLNCWQCYNSKQLHLIRTSKRYKNSHRNRWRRVWCIWFSAKAS